MITPEQLRDDLCIIAANELAEGRITQEVYDNLTVRLNERFEGWHNPETRDAMKADREIYRATCEQAEGNVGAEYKRRNEEYKGKTADQVYGHEIMGILRYACAVLHIDMKDIQAQVEAILGA